MKIVRKSYEHIIKFVRKSCEFRAKNVKADFSLTLKSFFKLVKLTNYATHIRTHERNK